jgi:hypothetical protein
MRRASTIRIYNRLLPSKFTGDLPQRGRRMLNCEFTGRNPRGSKSLPKFNLALRANATNARNSWTKLGVSSQINFSTALLRSAQRRPGETAMVSTDVTAFQLSPAEHQVQLRRAVIASTIGTAIEWYDFFLYSTVTGLVFAKLFFPNSDPWVGLTLPVWPLARLGQAEKPGLRREAEEDWGKERWR